jgi:site-specific DNA recombinase
MKETLHIYLRVSSQIQETEGTSLITQEQSGIDLSRQLGMDYQIHNEGGSSSNYDNLDNRPVMLKLLKLMDEGVVKNLYVWNTDRISRNQITFFTIRQKMIKNKVTLYTSNGKYNSENYMENMILGILSEVSQYDNRVRTERSRLGKLEKVKNNFWRGGDPPFGYKLFNDGNGNKLVEDENESKWVRFIFVRYSEGTTIKEIKTILETNKVVTRRGHSNWSLGSLQVILRNDTYIGIDTFVDKKSNLTITNNIPPLVGIKLWDEVQERRKRILQRKNQINKSKNFYLFRDFMECQCGTPIGGRIYKKKFIKHYYCPLSERKFNRSSVDYRTCSMKKCLNIPTTDTILWTHIINILSDTMIIKGKMIESGLFGIGKNRNELELEKSRILDEINQHHIGLKKIERGFVDLESQFLISHYPSIKVYEGIKKKLLKEHQNILLKIEDLKNNLQQVGNEGRWFDWIDRFGDEIRTKQDIPDIQKRDVLKSILNRIIVDYDHSSKVHQLTIHFKVPVMIGDEGSSQTTRMEIVPPTRGRKPKNQTNLISNYSTVINGVSNGGISNHRSKVQNYDPIKGHSLRLSVVLRLSNLWTSHYSPYQQELFNIITNLHNQGWNFKVISDWFNDNGYSTPRGKVFKENIVWSIYTKKNRSITRFSREYDPIINDIGIDVINYVPVP